MPLPPPALRVPRLPLRPRGALLALALAVATTGCAPEAPAPPEPLHGIVLVGLDTLRADGLSCYGNPRPTSPHIDALAARGLLFEDAVSNASWTLPGFIAILSGELPSSRIFRGRLLRSGAERLRDAGFRTAAFTEGAYVSAQFGLDRGFETFWEETEPVIQAPGPGVGVAKTFGKARAWLRENGGEPFFLFVHTYEPHVPYERMTFTEGVEPGRLGGPYDRAQNDDVLKERIPVGPTEASWVRALYDGGVAEADRHVGELLAELEALGVAGRTLVVVTSDHGEQLGEHQPRQLGLHGQTLWDTVLRVPLLIHDPRRSDGGRRIATQVRTVDVMPTILALAGLDPAGQLDGKSLLPVIEGRETADRMAYSELRTRRDGRLRAATLRAGRFKLHLNAPGSERPALELYDVAADPGEAHDLAADPGSAHERARLHADLQNRVRQIDQRGAARSSRKALDPGLRQRLEALGYVEER